MIPTLTTKRLTLRAPRPEDFPHYADIFASERSRYMDGPLDRIDAWHEFAADTIGWQFFGYGYWTVADSKTDAFLGFVGLANPPFYPEPELGWMVTESSEGKGIAFEAATAARNWAFATLAWSSVVSYIDPPNQRSIALAERLGATRDRPADAPSEGDLVSRKEFARNLQIFGVYCQR